MLEAWLTLCAYTSDIMCAHCSLKELCFMAAQVSILMMLKSPAYSWKNPVTLLMSMTGVLADIETSCV